jgi:hypothetical protein
VVFLATIDPASRPEPMKFPVFSLLAPSAGQLIGTRRRSGIGATPPLAQQT